MTIDKEACVKYDSEIRRHGQAVRQEPAKLLSPVQIRVSPFSIKEKGRREEEKEGFSLFTFHLSLIRAIGAVGSALERHSRGHPFEPDIAHHKKESSLRTLFFYANFPAVCGLYGCVNSEENLKERIF